MRLKTKRKDNGVVELDVTVTAREVDSIISQTQEGLIRQLELRPDGKTPLEQLAKEQAGIVNLEERIAQGAIEAMISGSFPNSWSETGRSASVVAISSSVCLFP